jgi:transcriptional regulator with XRE-family HTH domain
LTGSTARAKEILALNIKILRKKSGLTQEELAEKTDLSAQMINDIEGCRTWVSDKTLEKVADVLNVCIFELFVPQNKDSGDDQELDLFHRIEKLRREIKEGIDRKLNQYYIIEKNL